MPRLFDNNSYEQWLAEGSTDITRRALDHARKLLSEYQEPKLEEAKDEALREFIARREGEIPPEGWPERGVLIPDAVRPCTTRVYPAGILDTLSPQEAERLHDASRGNLSMLLRRCTLAVLHSGTMDDDAEALMNDYQDFELRVEQANRGLCLHLRNAPGEAFVEWPDHRRCPAAALRGGT